jgi:hypothetical protein
MSYLGRVARRAAGPRGAGGLTPAGASGSPLARFDQRLNMLGAPAEVGILPAGVRAPAGEDAGAAGDDIAFVAPPGAGEAPAPRGDRSRAARFAMPPEPAPHAAAQPASAEPRPEPAASEAGRASRRPPSAASLPSGTEPRLDPADAAELPTPRLARAPAAPDRAASGATAARSADRPRRRATDALAPADAARASAGGPRSGSAPAGEPIADAFAKLERWLASPPRQPRRGQGAGDDGPSGGERDGRNPTRVAAAGAGAPLGEARRPGAHVAGELASARPSSPRLRIGRIDVQVVMPPSPAPPVRRPGQGARVAPAAAADLPGYLTFGLRQR